MRYTLYHGTCPGSARDLIAKGWKPNRASPGANLGQPRYLYLTNYAENALWFANEKGCSSVVRVMDVPEDYLKVDPEDGTYDTVAEELTSARGLPGSVVLIKALGPEHFAYETGSFNEELNEIRRRAGLPRRVLLLRRYHTRRTSRHRADHQRGS